MVVKLEKARNLGAKFWDKMQKENLSTVADEALAKLLSDLTTAEAVQCVYLMPKIDKRVIWCRCTLCS